MSADYWIACPGCQTKHRPVSDDEPPECPVCGSVQLTLDENGYVLVTPSSENFWELPSLDGEPVQPINYRTIDTPQAPNADCSTRATAD
jgi:RNA polymerase subunit RPABC4/transcription elongation factor Spt4